MSRSRIGRSRFGRSRIGRSRICRVLGLVRSRMCRSRFGRSWFGLSRICRSRFGQCILGVSHQIFSILRLQFVTFYAQNDTEIGEKSKN
mgnify:CR=1 FL=1